MLLDAGFRRALVDTGINDYGEGNLMPLRESNALFSSKYLPYIWGLAFLYPAVHFLIIQFTTHSYSSSFVPVVLGTVMPAKEVDRTALNNAAWPAKCP